MDIGISRGVMRLYCSAAVSSFALVPQGHSWGRCNLVSNKQRSIARAPPRSPCLRCKNSSSSSSSTSSASSSSSSYSSSSSLESIAEQYDAFILDQFGVLHNGQTALPGAVQAVEYLFQHHKAKKKLMILSNTSAPAAGALERLPKYGFRPEWFAAGGAVTSGEEACKFLSSQQKNDPTTTKVLFWTWNDRLANNPRVTAPPALFLQTAGPHIQIAQSIPEAEYLLLHGSEVWNRGPDLPYIPLDTFINDGTIVLDGVMDQMLRECAIRNIPMICANPDEQVVTPTGGIAYMPGGIAKRYQELCTELSTTVVEHYVFGKPDPRHFQACVQALGADFKKIIHVGDSMHHDIVGATKAGIDTLFITSGIHAKDLGVASFGEVANDESLAALFQHHGVRPTHVLPAFCLGSGAAQ